MLDINTNILSLETQTNLNSSGSALSQAITRLSSGKRINTAADDAAGMAISTLQTASINALNQGEQNANDGISMVQTASGAISSTVSNLQRIYQLAVESGDGSLGSAAQADLQTEVNTRLTEINRVESQTTFNNQTVLGGLGSVNFQIGASANQTITANFGTTSWTTTGLGISGIDISTTSGAQNAMTAIQAALTQVNTFQATLGATQNTFTSAISDTQTESTNLSSAQSQLVDADYAQETANLSKAQVLQQAGISVLAQANSLPQNVLKLLQ
ncbi:flagellin domain-containing protein [Trinickia acidisoli]|uniref:flagellin domain-containing protein n=1 Tax=Trinickia acidisoli TaxID=2767482 RepID=UPI001A8F403C|nr:flagellin domain-containing protein [Trinickia acidisoli]